MAYTGNSIVDYLKSEGRDSSYSARKKLAAQYGISNYSGTAAQNTQLLKKLRSGAGTSSSAGSSAKSTTPVQTKSYATAYTPSATVNQKKQAWEAAENAVKNYGSYQSKYQSKLDELYDQIVNKKDFQYDLNADALYNQYKDQYSVLGKTAMMDTMGQAAALTGGYGNSYASTAGNQAYQAYLQQLNEQVPQLYQLALDKYNADRQDLYNQAGLTQDLENAAYGKWVDEYGRLVDERNYAQGVYGDERDFDYGSFTDERDYQTALDQWQQEMEYQKQRDAIADKQWQEEMNFRKQQAAKAAREASAPVKNETEEQESENTPNSGLNVSLAEILALGYGPISEDALLKLIRNGDVIYDKKTDTLRRAQNAAKSVGQSKPQSTRFNLPVLGF